MRMRFLQEIYGNIRNYVGREFPVFIKLGLRDIDENGLSMTDGCHIVSALSEMGMDAFEISCGITLNRESMLMDISQEDREAYFLPYAQAARKVTTRPLILVGAIRSVRIIERLINSNGCDFVAMCRPFIREQDLVIKIMTGKANQASCISWNKYCIGWKANITVPMKCFQRD